MPPSSSPRELTLPLDAMTYGGSALGRSAGKAVFVPGGLPGEIVRVVVEEDRASFVRARLLEVIEPSPDRITPPCPYFGLTGTACGGCHWQHISYTAQLRFKTAIVREQLQRIGKISDPPLRDILPSPTQWQYRNHAQFHVTPAGQPGYQAARSHHVIPIAHCLVIEPIVQEWLTAHQHLDRPTELRINVRSFNLPAAVARVQIKGVPLQVSAESFFQVNTALIETLVDQVLAKLDIQTTDTILDAYCGVGLFSRFMAPHAAYVIGVEANASAQADFAINLADFSNVEFQLGRVERRLPTISARFNAAVFDPPRAGCGPEVIDAVVAQQIDRVVMVSCDPSTLARDVRQLLDRDYRLIEVQPIDLFPHTYHIETIAVLQRSARTDEGGSAHA